MERGLFCCTGLQRHSVLPRDFIAPEWQKGASEHLQIGFRLLGTGSYHTELDHRACWGGLLFNSDVSAVLSQNSGLSEDLQGEIRHLVG